MTTPPPETNDIATALGTLLVKMGVLSESDLASAIALQETADEDALLGHQLVAHGVCTAEQIDVALKAQAQIRSADRSDAAMGVADIAAYRRHTTHHARRNLVLRAQEVVRKATGQGYPAIAVLTKD